MSEPDVITAPPGGSSPRHASRNDLSRLALDCVTPGEELSVLAEHLYCTPQLRSTAVRLARSLDHHSADDLLQMTLERVVRGIRSYRGEGAVLGWVARIMRNAHVELARREVSDRRRVRSHALEEAGDHSADPADVLDQQRCRAGVIEAWQRTSDDPDVRLFWRRVYLGQSVDQLVRATGHPRSTVYVMLKRGGSKLLSEFERVIGQRRGGRGDRGVPPAHGR